MIDGTKIEVRDSNLKNKLFYHPKLIFAGKQEWLSNFDKETIYTKETKQFKGILFCQYDNRLEILFSPHYYFNDNDHNANDFTVNNCINVFKEFITEFDLSNELENLKITNLEFGINARSPIDVRDLITYAKYHQNKEFFNDNDLAFSKSSFQPNRYGQKSRYKTIKFYAKSIQYPEYSEPDVFRFEVKSKKSAYINKQGIFNLADLMNPDVYLNLKQTILNEFNGVLILDSSLSTENLTKRQENQIKNYLNSDYWYRVRQRTQGKGKNEFWYAKQRYFKYLDLAGYNIHKDLYRIIEEKLNYLTNEKGMFCPPIEINEKGMFCHSSIVLNHTFLDFRVCPITGLNLSNEKEPATYARTTTLRALKENNPGVYNILKLDLLGNSIERPKFEQNEIKHLAKQIRNRFYNQAKIRKSNNYKKSKDQLTLNL